MTYPAPEPAADSYGTAEGVAALASTWTRDREWFDDDPPYVEATNPSLTTVVRWIDQASSMLNIALENNGFTVPLQQARSIEAAAMLIEEIVSDRARFVNNKGRFFSDDAQHSKVSMLEAIAAEIDAWVLMYAPGLEANGEQRSGLSIKFGVRTHNDKGEATFPIFQRDAFGNKFIDWENE